jgi:trimeric autotransporter adhesin
MHSFGLLQVLAATLLTATAAAQCSAFAAYGGGMNNTVLAVAGAANGDVFAGGVFSNAGGSSAARIARWNGTAWTALGSGVDNNVRAIATLPNGDLIAAGDFLNAGGAPANRIARWDGTNWSPLGLGVSSPFNPSGLYALAAMPNGDVIAAGFFQQAGGAPAAAIARWNGTTWAPLGSGILATVFALTALPNGDLLAGGNFTTAGGISASRIARWNGTSWSSLGSGITGFRVDAIAALPNGDIVVGGAFTAAGGSPASNIARWNGSTWSPLSSGMNGDVRALAVLPNGQLLAGGQFTTAGGIAAIGMARWNGSAWAAVGFTGTSQVYALATAANDDRIVGGFFTGIGPVGAGMIARFRSTCPATAVNSAAGCASSGGANAFAARTQPWLGSTFQARGTGLPSTALAVVATGFSTVSVPLAAVLPPSPAACTLATAPDLIAVQLPSGGVLDTTLALPNAPTLVGAVLYQQLVLLELDPVTFATVQNTVSNRLTLTTGTF